MPRRKQTAWQKFWRRKRITSIESIALDQVPVFDLYKMGIQIVRGRTWDGFTHDYFTKRADFITIVVRSISLVFTVFAGFGVYNGDLREIGIYSFLTILMKVLGTLTYVYSQLRHNRRIISKKYPWTTRVVDFLVGHQAPQRAR